MEVFVVGLNHKTAPIEVREKLCIPPHKTVDFFKAFSDRGIFEERLLLSTCNRTEIYGAARSAEESVRLAKAFLSEYSNLELSCFEDKLYVLRQPESVNHIFSVASGLDSMVLGETEIIGQVKDAYQTALQHHQTGKVLNALFQKSLKVAKDVRTQTQIGSGRVSVASVAVDLAEKIFADMKGKKVMVIGTGEMSSQVLKAMASRGTHPLIVSSRHHERAQELAVEMGGEAVHFESFHDRIAETDILVASTLAPSTLIHEKQVRAWMKLRHGRPLFLVDIAMPRNIEAAAGDLENVYLYDLDDLRSIAERNMGLREGQLSECLRLVGRQTQFFMDWMLKEFGAPSAFRVGS